MKKEKNELAQFVVGMLMLGVGLYLFMHKVHVSSSFLSGNMRIGGMDINQGLVVVPFIVGVIMIFVKPESILSKIVFVMGILIIIFSVISSTQIRLVTVTLYEWIIYLVLIFGGFGLVGKILLKSNNSEKEDKKTK